MLLYQCLRSKKKPQCAYLDNAWFWGDAEAQWVSNFKIPVTNY